MESRSMRVLERRRGQRFEVGWNVTIKGVDSRGAAFDEEAALRNLSSGGAFLYLTRRVNVGDRLSVWIKVPFKKENWMQYSAEVVRVEKAPSNFGVAMKFDTARPKFTGR